MARRRKARSNPDNTALIIAGVFGLVAVGGVVYVVTRPSTAAAAQVPPTNDALTLPPVAASSYVDPTSGFDMNAMTQKAVTFATLDGGRFKSNQGVYWANIVKAHSPTAAQLQALTAAGY